MGLGEFFKWIYYYRAIGVCMRNQKRHREAAIQGSTEPVKEEPMPSLIFLFDFSLLFPTCCKCECCKRCLVFCRKWICFPLTLLSLFFAFFSFEKWRHRDASETPPTQCYKRMFWSGTFENEVFRQFFFVLITFSVTLLLYFFLIFNFPVDPEPTGIWCGVVAAGVSIGCIFSKLLRALGPLVFLELLCAKGRVVLLTVMLIMALNGAGMKAMENVQICGQIVSCTQHQVKLQAIKLGKAFEPVAREMAEPFKKGFGEIKLLVEKLLETVKAIEKAIRMFARAVQSSTEFLDRTVVQCNRDELNPATRCAEAVHDTVHKCWDKITYDWYMYVFCGGIYWFMPYCGVAHVTQFLCHFPKVVKEFVKENIHQRIKDSLQKVIDEFKDQYWVTIDMKQQRSYNISVEHELLGIYGDMLTIVDRYRFTFADVISWLLTIYAGVMLTRIVWKSLLYLSLYLKSLTWDNHYVTYELRQLDQQKENRGQPTVLPLLSFEKWRWFSISRLGFTYQEWYKVITNLMKTTIGGLSVALVLLVDYCVYKMMVEVVGYFEDSAGSEPISSPSFHSVTVQGKGLIAGVYNKIAKAVTPIADVSDSQEIWSKCIQKPKVPEYELYNLLLYLLCFCYLTCFLDVYLQRLRHSVCAWVYPARERQRAANLFNEIYFSRCDFVGNFNHEIKNFFQRLKVDPKAAMGAKNLMKDQLDQGLRQVAYSFPLIGKAMHLFGIQYKTCTDCGQIGKAKNEAYFHMCENEGCNAVYCGDCFSPSLMCKICGNKVQAEIVNFVEVVDSNNKDDPRMRKLQKLRAREAASEHAD